MSRMEKAIDNLTNVAVNTEASKEELGMQILQKNLQL